MGFKNQYASVKIFNEGIMSQVAAPFEYFVDSIGVIVVPKGYKVNLNIVGRWTLPSILHSYLYDCGYKYGVSRKKADEIYYEALVNAKVSKFVARVIWLYARVMCRKKFLMGG